MTNKARLPIPGQDANNWGAIINEYLRVSHHEDGTSKGDAPVANVRDFGAKGDGLTDDTPAIAQAIQTGEQVYFPTGVYRYNKLVFNQSYQQITCAPNAILRPLNRDSLISFEGGFQVIRNLRVDTESLNEVNLLIQILGSGCRFEGLQIWAPTALTAVYMEGFTVCVFVGGDIKGFNGSPRKPNSVGLKIKNAFEIRAFGLAVEHWETGILFTGWSYEDPSFFGCSIENNDPYAVRFAPTYLFNLGLNYQNSLDAGLITAQLRQAFSNFNVTLGQGAAVTVNQAGSQWHITDGATQYLIRTVNGVLDVYRPTDQPTNFDATMYNLQVISCHFEGSQHYFYIDPEGILAAGLISGCIFGAAHRVINAQGMLYHLTVTGCYIFAPAMGQDDFIWEVEGWVPFAVDLLNYWYLPEDQMKDPPPNPTPPGMYHFATGRYAGRITRFSRTQGFLGIGKSDPSVPLEDDCIIKIQATLSHQAGKLGFYGANPIAQPPAYSVSNSIEQRAFDASTATVADLASALGTLIGDLKKLGLIG